MPERGSRSEQRELVSDGDEESVVSGATSDGDDANPCGWSPQVMLGGGVVAALAILGVVMLATTARKSVAREIPPCFGFEGECPAYPEPMLFGTWPKTYNDSGGQFPKDFVWGLGTAAYQIEGAYNEGGRGASIWDTYSGANTVGMPGANCSYCCKEAPCPINPHVAKKGATGNVACDHYHTYKADVALMKSMGLKNYRFSIAWPRIVPTGHVADGVNQEALTFYNDLIKELLANDITPYVTLYHWDLPQGLMDPPGLMGWWSRNATTGEPDGAIQDEWLAYVDVCFKEFGDRVKFWVTFNEGWSFTWLASGWGKAPSIAAQSNMSVDPLIATHNVLNAHAAAVDLYRRKYQPTQQGKIGIINNMDWVEPKTEDPEDIAAAARRMEFQLGWWSDPIFLGQGDYPRSMRVVYGDRLPKFTPEQSRLINGSADFFGLNHYGTGWVEFAAETGPDLTYAKTTHDGPPFGFKQGQSAWLFGSGWGFRKLLNWVSKRYHHPPIYVTEVGWSTAADNASDGSDDPARTGYYANYTAAMLQAINEDGVDVRGFFGWSLMDNYEWEMGYVERFGTTFNDYDFGYDPNAPTNNDHQPTAGRQKRRRKNSNCWLEAVWTNNTLVDPYGPEFTGCVTSGVFNTSFVDPAHTGCTRQIIMTDGETGTVTGTQPLVPMTPCNGFSDIAYGPLPVTASGGSIVANFSAANGPEFMPGYWNRATNSINWGDGTDWQAQSTSETATM